MAIGKPILEGSSQAQKRSRTQILTPSDPKISGQEPKTLSKRARNPLLKEAGLTKPTGAHPSGGPVAGGAIGTSGMPLTACPLGSDPAKPLACPPYLPSLNDTSYLDISVARARRNDDKWPSGNLAVKAAMGATPSRSTTGHVVKYG